MAGQETSASASDWLPDLCQPRAVLAVALLAELVALTAVLVPVSGQMPWYARIGPVSLHAQGVALLSLVFLCASRPWLRRLPLYADATACLALIVAIGGFVSAVAYGFDLTFALTLGGPHTSASRFVFGSMVLCLLLGGALLRYAYVHRQWQLQVQAVARAELEALQARIRPHFLFNSMNTIAGLVRLSPSQAEAAVEDLAELFRAALSRERGNATLAAEIDLLQRYLAIEALRLGDRLHYRIDLVDPPADLELPPLVLQPLVENAVYHGIQPLPEGGSVEIDGFRCAGGYCIQIRNPRPQRAVAGGHGMALDNTRRRLRHHFGDAASLQVEAGTGTFECRLLLPATPAEGGA